MNFFFFLPFHAVHGVLEARILEWLAIPFSSGPHFVRTLHHDLSFLGGPAQHELHKAVIHVIILVSFLWLWFLLWRLWDCSSWLLCLPSDGWGWEACGSFLVGGTGYGENWVLLWWAEPMLNKSLIQLSADRPGCAPSLLVVWPEEAQCWSLQALW